MRKIHQKIQQFISEYFVPHDIASGVFSVVASFFTAFAIVFLLSQKLYNGLPQYEDFIVGLTTFSAYPKQADMQIISYLLIGMPVLYCLFVLCMNLWSKYMLMDKRLRLGFIVMYFTVLLSVFADKEVAFDLAVLICVGLIIAIPLFFNSVAKIGDYVNLLLVLIFFEYSYYGVYSFLNSYIGLGNARIPFFQIGQVLVLCIVVFASVLMRKKKEEFHYHKWLQVSQLFLPVIILNFYHFNYVYEAADDVMRLYETTRYHLFVLAIFVLMVLYEAYYALKKKNGIMLTSIVAIAMLKVYTLPKAVLNIDFFHNGEITVPMQQLVSYHKVPYKDLIPIHGLCDYFYGAVNYLLFDGKYMSLNAASVVCNLLMISLIAIVIYYFFEKKEQALLCVYLFSSFFIHTAGMRYLFLFIMFFILFSQKVRTEFLSYLWWWVLLSIVAIAWNPSIGGSAAIAFLPIILYRAYKEAIPQFSRLLQLREEHDKKWLIVMRVKYILLLVAGISFIPLFLQIIIYLKENTSTTVIANGMGMIGNLTKLTDYLVPGFVTGSGQFFLQTFMMLIPFLVCFLCVLYGQNKERKRQGIEYAICLFGCFYVIANYAFVRYDNGLRTGVVGVFFTILILFALFAGRKNDYSRSKSEMLIAFLMLMLCIYQADDSIIIQEESLKTKEYVEAEQETTIMGETIQDPVVYVTGDSVGISGLGNGFIGGNALNSLKNINAVLNGTVGERGSYVDLTNAVANYVIFDKASTFSYTSGYNISNTLMQEKAIETLKKEQPKLILVAPFIKFDDATISLRCGKLYDYMIHDGYEPYMYGNVIYLLKDAEPIDGSAVATEAFANLMHKESLQYLPAVWGNNGLEEQLDKSDVSYHIENKNASEESRSIVFDTPIKGDEISYIALGFDDVQTPLLQSLETYDMLAKGAETDADKEQMEVDLKDLDHLTISFYSQYSGERKQYFFTAYLYGDSYLIPVKSSPYWTMEEQLEGFEVIMQSTEAVNLDNMQIELFR